MLSATVVNSVGACTHSLNGESIGVRNSGFLENNYGSSINIDGGNSSCCRRGCELDCLLPVGIGYNLKIKY